MPRKSTNWPTSRPGQESTLTTPPEEPPSSAACVTGLHTAFFTLSDTVLIALASVIGMFLAILNWLYPREKEKSL